MLSSDKNLGLDKWLKPEEETKRLKKREKKDQNISQKKSSEPKQEKSETAAQKPLEKAIKELLKFKLVCSNSKCKYQKIIMKKQLTEKDRTCPRCSGVMKLKEN